MQRDGNISFNVSLWMENSIFAFIIYIARNRDGNTPSQANGNNSTFPFAACNVEFLLTLQFSPKIRNELITKVTLVFYWRNSDRRTAVARESIDSDLAHTQLFNRSVKNIFRLRNVSQAIYYSRINSYVILYRRWSLLGLGASNATARGMKTKDVRWNRLHARCTLYSLHVHVDNL